MIGKDFSILITTKNRVDELKITLEKCLPYIRDHGVSCIVYDDGSSDGTSKFVLENFPQVKLLINNSSKGYLYNRNVMLNSVSTKYAISLDDDSNFLSENVLFTIDDYFLKTDQCGLLALRIFWGENIPIKRTCNQKPHLVNGFVGCGHVWKMSAWHSIANYPEWFEFYGEETFAALQMFKNKWEIHYLPSVLIHHRVNMKARKNNTDYVSRQRQSLNSGWYLYFLCLPKRIILRKFSSSVWSQLKRKVFKGDIKATKAIGLAFFDLIKNSPKYFGGDFRLTSKEYLQFINLPDVETYWESNGK